MACGGLTQCELHYDTISEKKQGNSTLRLLKVAFEMRKFTQPLTYGREGNKILLKIGIHHGPVIAGVIGHHKPQFSLIGDTVNTTSRLCSTGRDGKIIISEKAYHQVKDHNNLAFFDRKVDAKGKGELLTYEVKLLKRTTRKKKSPKKTKRSPLEDIKHSLEKYQESMNNGPTKKIRLFEEILLKSESPSDLNISTPTPTIFKKSMSTQIDLLTLVNTINGSSDKKIKKFPHGILGNLVLEKHSSLEKSEKPMPQLKLNLMKENKQWPFAPKTSMITRLSTIISPAHKKTPRTPEGISPVQADNNGFSFFGKDLPYKTCPDLDSDEQKIKTKPECIKEEEENPSDFSPELNEASNQKSVRSDEAAYFVEEIENEETFPGEFSTKFNKSNTSFETVDEEEDFDNQISTKNLRENSSSKNTQKDLLRFSQLTLRFTNQNDEEIIQDFNETLYDDYMNGFENQHGNKVISRIGVFVYIFEFIILLLNGGLLTFLRVELIVLRVILFCGFIFWFKGQHFLYSLNYLNKTSWVLFLLWLFIIDFSYSDEISKESNGFREITKFFGVLCFSHFSYVTFLETLVMSCLNFIFYLIFQENFSSAKNLFLIISTIFILYTSYKNYLSRLNQFNYCLINKQKKSQQNDLLMHLLPNHIFKKFMTNPDSKSELIDEFDYVTMLFADIKGFTEFSAKRTPTEVVNMLRDLFTEFDKLCLKNNVYKLYTIGDCYVVLGMIDGEKRDSIEEEAKNIILMAFSMIDTIRLVRKKLNYNGLDMRIGIHTGSIIGGIIGTDIVRYDIYGKDVLIANKMESNGKEGHIMVSEVTKNLLEQYYGNVFSFEYYKEVNIPSLKTNIGGYFIYPNSSIY